MHELLMEYKVKVIDAQNRIQSGDPSLLNISSIKKTTSTQEEQAQGQRNRMVTARLHLRNFGALLLAAHSVMLFGWSRHTAGCEAAILLDSASNADFNSVATHENNNNFSCIA